MLAADATVAGGPDAGAAPVKLYHVLDGKADRRTYNGYRRYNSICIHCHGPDGIGSSFAPSLIEAPLDLPAFREVVLAGRTNGSSVMKGFAGDGNVEPYIEDIYAYLQARHDGALGRGRPGRLD
ncbi:MAG TPA: cytochrome c [Candidatus Acidoferrum sp.]|nr:cytochrome c [Candidatus Acidoferrum sp.]